MKKKEQILSLWGTVNPKTGKAWSKLGISKKVKVSRTYVYLVLEPIIKLHSEAKLDILEELKSKLS